jgi:asparagine synthase (glutamine-hydrolysing)
LVAANEPADHCRPDLIEGAADQPVWTFVGQLQRQPLVEVSPRLADSIATMSGRFSVVAADPAGSRLAAATSPSGGDPLFFASADGGVIVSSWALPIARILGTSNSTVDPIAMCSMVNNGFMGTRRTPFPGVLSLGPSTTLVVDGERVETHDRLGEMIVGQRPATAEALDRLHDAFVAAFAPLRASAAPVGLALSGGKDSRLVLAGLLANGIEVQTSTVSMGSANDGDVSIARRIAELTGIRHSVRPALTEGGLPADRVVDLYSDTCRTLRLTEGMLHGFKTFAPRTLFRSDSVSLGGGGGEVLRGGYGHGFLSPKLQPLAQVVSREIVKRFTRFAPVIRATYSTPTDPNCTTSWRKRPPDCLAHSYSIAPTSTIAAAVGWPCRCARPA